ncbi:peptidylprolyl isomerase [Sphingosinicella rhizophila]|uniref:Parvulin-like PPIase n=1 Tax=Sphingosinicella rhizophila TaxID=3050082 RepID=A0ABU3Q2U9_9SPHN|nr:peptidylprolyl isomerase [Sphingosinicella sp. GR2756]MDT9597727.1 peptidylprolyl isomerase [Sphingosinicella sp. GR2756]
MMKLGTFSRAALVLAGSIAAVAVAQTADEGAQPQLSIPDNVEFLAPDNAGVRKATAIVNGDVITGTDVDQRVALIVLANEGRIPAEEMQRLRAQVLRNLVDETLQIQAAAAEDIKIEPREIDTLFGRYAQSFNRTPQDFVAYLKSVGSSERSFKRQIHAQIAWNRLQGRRIEPFVNVAEEEVRAVIDRLNAAKGTQEYKIGEIFLSATPETAAETRANADRIVQQIRNGASFFAYARQFSEASTAAVGGDLGWVRAAQLPEQLAATAQALSVGQVSDPVAIPGGYSIVALQDTRQVLTADPRDAILSLKQVSISFPPGTPRNAAEEKLQALSKLGQEMGGCGRAEAAAATIGAEVLSNDQMRVRDLPPPLQEVLLKLSIGQSTPPFGSVEDGVRILVLCGRDDPQQMAGASFEKEYARMTEERVNRRAMRYLRDLRRDAVVDYR